MAFKKISGLDPAIPITGDELIELVQLGGNVKGTISAILDYLSSKGAVIYCGAFDLSGGSLSVLVGTGTDGAIKKGNQFYVSLGGAITLPDGGNVLKGMVLQAKVNSPGASLADMTEWMVFSTNTD